MCVCIHAYAYVYTCMYDVWVYVCVYIYACIYHSQLFYGGYNPWLHLYVPNLRFTRLERQRLTLNYKLKKEIVYSDSKIKVNEQYWKNSEIEKERKKEKDFILNKITNNYYRIIVWCKQYRVEPSQFSRMTIPEKHMPDFSHFTLHSLETGFCLFRVSFFADQSKCKKQVLEMLS